MVLEVVQWSIVVSFGGFYGFISGTDFPESPLQSRNDSCPCQAQEITMGEELSLGVAPESSTNLWQVFRCMERFYKTVNLTHVLWLYTASLYIYIYSILCHHVHLFSGRWQHLYFEKTIGRTAVEKCYPGWWPCRYSTLCQHLDNFGICWSCGWFILEIVPASWILKYYRWIDG